MKTFIDLEYENFPITETKIFIESTECNEALALKIHEKVYIHHGEDIALNIATYIAKQKFCKKETLIALMQIHGYDDPLLRTFIGRSDMDYHNAMEVIHNIPKTPTV